MIVEILKIVGIAFVVIMVAVGLFNLTPAGKKMRAEAEERRRLDEEEKERERKRKAEEENKKRDLLKDKDLFLVVRCTDNIVHPAREETGWTTALREVGVRVRELEPKLGTAVIKGLEAPQLESLPENSLILRVVLTRWHPSLGGYECHQYEIRILKPQACNREVLWSKITPKRSSDSQEEIERRAFRVREELVKLYS